MGNLDNGEDETLKRWKFLFKDVFTTTAEGKEVLVILLDMLLYNKKIILPEEIALHNTAVEILRIMGLEGSGEIVDKIF